MHGTITSEENLYFVTIRTVHTICKEQMALTKMLPLIELQHATGVMVSYKHGGSGSQGALGEGALTDWLHAGAVVFMRRMRDRASNSIMASLFPSGIIFGSLGDGSNDRSLREQEASVLRFIGSDGLPYNTLHSLLELDLTDSTDGRSPDAKCITAAYVRSYEQLQEHTVHTSRVGPAQRR